MNINFIGLIPGANIPAEMVSGTISLINQDYTGVALSAAGLIPFVGEGAVSAKILRRTGKLIGAYESVRKDSRRVGQADKIFQYAAFGEEFIAKKKSAAINLIGNVFKNVESEHRKVHQAMEEFWDLYRRSGVHFGTTPTIGKYLSAQRASLKSAGLNNKAVKGAIKLAKQQLSAIGKTASEEVPRIPGKIYMK